VSILNLQSLPVRPQLCSVITRSKRKFAPTKEQEKKLTPNCFFEKMNIINKFLARLINNKRKRFKLLTSIMKQGTDTEINITIKEFCE
jgi:hypothetical protein